MDDLELQAYEGLIFSTARRYVDILDDDLEDIQQALRIKVWQALRAWDTRRSPRAVADPDRVKEARDAYVFSCVRNRMKDMFKGQDRRNKSRGGGLLHIEDISDDLGKFEGRYLSAECERLRELEESNLQLPSTLNETERAVVHLLVLDYGRNEIAVILGISRHRVRAAHQAVQTKMEDWRPTPAPESVPLAA